MSDIVKKDTSLPILSGGKLRSSLTSFQRRIAKQRDTKNLDTLTMPHRICLMLDVSGSMDTLEGPKQRIELLKDAIQNFASRCDFSNTAIAMETFPKGVSLELHRMQSLIITTAMSLTAGGGTPLHECMTRCIDAVPMTRGIIVSDGGATDWSLVESTEEDFGSNKNVDPLLQRYKERSIPVDTVHISESSSGEHLLRRIAEITGGVFIKFSDVGAFSKAFGFLTPGFRALLTSGEVTASQIGAKQLEKSE